MTHRPEAISDWAQRYLGAWNDRDVEPILDFMSEDVVITDVPLGERAEATTAVRDLTLRIMRAYSSDFRRKLGGVVVADGAAYAFEFTESGVNDLTAPGSGFPATGRPTTSP